MRHLDEFGHAVDQRMAIEHYETGWLRGICYDKTFDDPLFKTIKSELIWRTAFAGRAEAARAIGQCIEGFHDPRR